ncbi:MAG: hypothetical protein EP346_01475 [Bacteroidetes bacterium]|nr:MAG: hypothetical protein EP346_01475 [Bacteroidota bacterium]
MLDDSINGLPRESFRVVEGSPVTRHPSSIIHHPSSIIHHPSPITHHPSPVIHPQLSPLNSRTFLL